MIKVVYYARVSTEEEKQLNALKTQIEELEEVIANNPNWELVDRYIDEGISGTNNEKRDDFTRLIQDLYTDKFDIVVVKDETRVIRNAYESGYFLNPLIINHKKLYYYLDRRFFNPKEELLNSVKYGMAGQFSRDLSEKINNSQKKRMAKGRIITNGRMWGYDQVKGQAQLIINEKEAEFVRFVFEQYVKGLGFRKIKTMIDEKGIKSHNGTPFSITTLKRIIKNEKYKGILIMGKQHKDYDDKKMHPVPESEWVIKNDIIPPIVSTELWERANNLLESKRKATGLDDKIKIAGYFSGTYAYSSKIKCGKCGKPYYHHSASKKNKEKAYIWECKGYREYGKDSENGCDNLRIFNYEMDDIIKESIFEFWQDKDETIKNVMDVLEEVLSDNQYQETIDKLNQDKYKLEKKKDKLIELYSDELISKEEFKKRNDEHNLSLGKIEDQIKELVEKNKNLVNKKERLLKSKNFLQSKLNNKDEITDDIIKDFLNEVVISPDHIEITLNGDSKFFAKKDEDHKYSLLPNVTTMRTFRCGGADCFTVSSGKKN